MAETKQKGVKQKGELKTARIPIKIVPVELCLGVRDQLSNALLRSAGVAELQHFLASSPSIQRNLVRRGYEMADVLAVDLQGNTLIVYVI